MPRWMWHGRRSLCVCRTWAGRACHDTVARASLRRPAREHGRDAHATKCNNKCRTNAKLNIIVINLSELAGEKYHPPLEEKAKSFYPQTKIIALENTMATAQQDVNQPGSRNMRVPTYLVQSIITIIIAFLLFPPLILISWISLMFAFQTQGLLNKGDIDAARMASERARAWSITTYWLTVIFFTVLTISISIVLVLMRNA